MDTVTGLIIYYIGAEEVLHIFRRGSSYADSLSIPMEGRGTKSGKQ